MIKNERIDEILKEIREASRKVPFGNSAFQIQHFTGGNEAGPECSERRQRTLLLNLNGKLQALRECQFRRARLDIDLREIEVKINELTHAQDPHGFQRERLELDKAEKLASLHDEDKLIEDALIELECMYREWKSLPPLKSREDFENSERRYWLRRLAEDARREIDAQGAPSVATLASLNSIGLNIHRNSQGQWELIGPGIELLPPPDRVPKYGPSFEKP